MSSRIEPGHLGEISEVITDKAVMTGGDMARQLDVEQATLWAWLNRYGVPTNRAAEMADILETWGERLSRVAVELRVLAYVEETPHEAVTSWSIRTQLGRTAQRVASEMVESGKLEWDEQTGYRLPRASVAA